MVLASTGVEVNMNCDPILDMRLSQTELKALYERNPALAKRNPVCDPGCIETPPAFRPVNISQAKPSKYRNIKVEFDGMKFDSKHELECWKNLKLREKAGEIYDLERQVPFALEVNGIKIGRFTADFMWKEHMDETTYQRVVADAKSPVTRKETSYRLRKRIFEAQYGLAIREL